MFSGTQIYVVWYTSSSKTFVHCLINITLHHITCCTMAAKLHQHQNI